ncbi:MAG: hypothetical protein WBZ36_03060, partial [Candidatus Nitrosopolaris sp.]
LLGLAFLLCRIWLSLSFSFYFLLVGEHLNGLVRFVVRTLLEDLAQNAYSLFIRDIATFIEIGIYRYRFIWLCVYKNMQRTLNSAQKTTELLVINGTLPNISILGDEQKSERAAEIKRKKIIANISCSVFSTGSVADISTNENFHLLVDVGEGVVESLEKSGTDVTSQSNGLVLNFE